MINKNANSVNLHFWPYCNMNCKYCFANFSHIKITLSKKDWFEIILQLADFGIRKVNFVGGEPTLCPFLGELIIYSKNLELITGIVSNGTRISQQFIEQYGNSIDWIGLSLDSGNEITQQMLGRGDGFHVRNTIKKSKMIKDTGIKLKINSVITRLNVNEDMSKVMDKIHPDRWKVFQVLAIEGQNNENVKDLKITTSEFLDFIRRHEKFNPIAEDNDAMLESYIMVDPMGRFYQNSGEAYNYSMPILEVGVLRAINQVVYDHAKFIERGGIYAY